MLLYFFPKLGAFMSGWNYPWYFCYLWIWKLLSKGERIESTRGVISIEIFHQSHHDSPGQIVQGVDLCSGICLLSASRIALYFLLCVLAKKSRILPWRLWHWNQVGKKKY
jgi:hypothetical protein